ncbi:alkane hydroxylase MAH1-like [Vicia villosa]|uniref:alkane hydroxylase MAH1-like n=1 Tax=Vicia villosa TaxID=3911 RepID=UPI00273B1EE2|nr:alkane hydroxylase MAH1-like [Vicia villosa]
MLYRHCIPKCIWMLQRWLQIGQEKKNKIAQQILHQFLSKRITKSKDMEESHSCLLKELIMKGGLEKDEMVENEKYIRDAAVNLLLAGNGTISSGLCWFFWLVSTHPNVEAKIIQEIKDNCENQEEDFITYLSVEKLDKLLYLHGAIYETMRLYPTVPLHHNCANKSDVLPS